MTAIAHWKGSILFRSGFLSATLTTALCAAAWPGTARANFTCSNNQDCAGRAAQCDPGRTPCDDGICRPGDPDADNIGCVLIPNDGKCDDGNFCNGVEFCLHAHGCRDAPPPDCDDDIACTGDQCDAQLGCTHTRHNSLCSNGLFCDGKEICDATRGCIDGTPPKCGDKVDCTTDFCDEAHDVCAHTPNDSVCNNGLFCDGTSTCDPASGCRPVTLPNCNDNIPCTADSCDEAHDTCSHVANNALCSDGLFCDGVETCSPTQGCRPGTPPNCNDNVLCTADACDETNDVCSHTTSNAPCSDGLFCDGVEICSPTQGCQPGTPPNCSDNVTCTSDRCVETTDSCEHTPRDSNCSNNIFCDGVEVCSPTLGCQPGTPPSCADNIPCTTDQCIEATHGCSHTPNDTACSNGQFCDGPEICDILIGCHHGTPPNCADAIPCTVDVCVEETDTCAHMPNDFPCSNGLFCDGSEVCNPTLGCTFGTPPDCADTIACTTDFCSEDQNACVHQPNNQLCTDGQFCDGVEVCNPLTGCQPGTPPICADVLVCTDDSCNETIDRCVHEPNGTLCGNGVIDGVCGEVCDDGPVTGEICNNDIDDDHDGLIDCADPDCANLVFETCDNNCHPVPPCQPLRNDPALISFGGTEATSESSDGSGERSAGPPGQFSFHARLIPTTEIDPLRERFVLTLSNDNGVIYRAELDPSRLRADGKRFRYYATDLGAVARDGGIAKLSIQQRTYGGQVGYAFRVRAIGDFSRATLALMTTQVYFGDDVGYVTALWTGEPGHWVLRQKDYDVP